jgi:nucleotide-binding universal stress UspA family protein
MSSSYVIVVGVDGSEGGRRALRWAAREATARGATVEAVAAWRWDLPSGGVEVDGDPDEDPKRRAARMLAAQVADLPAGVSVTAQVLEGRPAEVLGTAARAADLLVLGSHGHSRAWHTVLGSVAEECVRTATCPVVVIPVPRDEAETDR